MRLDHCCLNVRDMDATIRFYTERLGMRLLSRRDMPESIAELAFVGYEEGDMRLELTHWRGWSQEEYVEGSLFDHIAIIVDDVHRLLERLRGEGVKVAKEPRALSSGSVIAFVHDLDGNWIELIQKA